MSPLCVTCCCFYFLIICKLEIREASMDTSSMFKQKGIVQFDHSVVPDSVTSWTKACQASLSINNSWSQLKLMSTESVMPSNHLILCVPFSSRLQSFLATGSFPMSQFFTSGGQTMGVSGLASVLPMNIQDFSFRMDWLDHLAVQGTQESSTPQFKTSSALSLLSSPTHIHT